MIFGFTEFMQFFAYRISEFATRKIAGFQHVQIIDYAAIWRICCVKPYVKVHIKKDNNNKAFKYFLRAFFIEKI